MKTQFEEELQALINKYSKENESDTPDFILARYLNAVLENFNAAVNDREEWYGRMPKLVEGFDEYIPDSTGTPPPEFPPITSVDLNGMPRQLTIDYDNSNPIIDYDNTNPIIDLQS